MAEKRNQNTAPSVLVLDASGAEAAPTSAPRARYLLGQGLARVAHRDPFTIQLARHARPLEEKSGVMPMLNFTEFFAEEKDVWIRFLRKGQLSLNFRDGDHEVSCPPVPYTGDPYQLTQYVPFELIKKSTDFRRIVSAIPPVVEVMTHDQAMAFFAAKAKKLGLASAEEAYARAEKLRKDMVGKEREQSASVQRRELKDVKSQQPEGMDTSVVVEGMSGVEVESGSETPEFLGATKDMAQPSVIGIAQGDLNARDSIEQLERMEEQKELRVADLMYVAQHSDWPTVRKWATKRLNAEAEGEKSENEPVEV